MQTSLPDQMHSFKSSSNFASEYAELLLSGRIRSLLTWLPWSLHLVPAITVKCLILETWQVQPHPAQKALRTSPFAAQDSIICAT